MWDLRLHGFMAEEELVAPKTREPYAVGASRKELMAAAGEWEWGPALQRDGRHIL